MSSDEAKIVLSNVSRSYHDAHRELTIIENLSFSTIDSRLLHVSFCCVLDTVDFLFDLIWVDIETRQDRVENANRIKKHVP
jgi:hypothetical protein